MDRSESAGTYIIAALCGVLSLGVVVGPELLAGLPRPVAEVTPAPPRTGLPGDDRTLSTAPAAAQVPAPPTPPPAPPIPIASPHTQPATPRVNTSRTTHQPPNASPHTRPATPRVSTSRAAHQPPNAPPHTQPVTPAPTQPLDRGRQLAHSFYGGQPDQVWAAFLPAVKAQWGSLAAFKAYRTAGAQAYGAEKSVLKEQVTRDGGVTYYTRTARFERGPGDGWTLILGFDAQGRVREFGVVGAGLLPGTQPTRTR